MEDTSDLEKTLEYRPVASVRPMALDVARARRTVPSGTIAALLLVAFAFVGAVVARFGMAASAGRPAPAAPKRVESPHPVAPAAPPATSDVPVVDVASLPRVPIGTVIGAPKHRLWIDGHLAAGWRKTVRCGVHTVQVGSAGEERVVDVPCGAEISVSP